MRYQLLCSLGRWFLSIYDCQTGALIYCETFSSIGEAIDARHVHKRQASLNPAQS